jgi:hypothetical protein
MTTTKTAAELKTYRDQYVATRASALAEARRCGDGASACAHAGRSGAAVWMRSESIALETADRALVWIAEVDAMLAAL